MSYDGSLKFDTKIDESGFSSGISKLGSIAKGGLAVLGTAVAGTVTAFAALTKSSLDAVASMEQNIGGIETLLGTRGAKSVEEYAQLVGQSVDSVAEEFEMLEKAQTLALDNANKAYKTAGLSANEYMETVTGFAAALKQSTASELEAAEIADQAVIDMADNANKMGTAMESIQNAYQGFAKQNYTMLDNLKLGYGGTKEEMQRLLKDAQELSGVEYDISNLSDVYSAIHVIQEELGITGTTAAEAATTIEGSMNSAKAAWENFLAGSGSVDELVDALSTVTGVVGKNLSEIIPRLLETVPKAISKLPESLSTALADVDFSGIIDSGKELVLNLVDGMISSIPTVASTGMEILDSLADSLMQNAPRVTAKAGEISSGLISEIQKNVPQITAKAGEIVSALMSGIQNNAPQMLTAAVDLFASFVQGIAEQLPTLVPQALQMIVTLADAVISNIPTIVNAGISLLKGLVQGIINGLPTLITEGPRIINEFANAIYSAIGQLITTGWEMIKSLAQGIWDNRGLIKENAGAIFEALINIFSLSKMLSLGKSLITNMTKGISSLKSQVLSSGKDILKNLVNGIKSLATHPVTTLKSIAVKAMNAFTNINWGSVGKNIISGIANGLAASAGAIVDAAKNAAKKALDAAKDFLGIHSPSTVFRDVIGKNMALGMGIGFEDNMPVEDFERSVDDIINKTRKRISGVESSGSVGMSGIVKDVTNNYTGGTIDYKKIKKAQREAMNEANERPVMLDRRQINRIQRDGGVVPVW